MKIWDGKGYTDMRKLDARQELMVILMEECGELIQEASKNLRRGELFNNKKFKDEVGDVYTMIDLLHEWDVVSWDEIEKRREVKRKKLSEWSDLISDDEVEKPHPPKSEQQVSAYGVTWTQKEYTQDMTGTGDYLNMPQREFEVEETKTKNWLQKMFSRGLQK
tara:strand:+ start:388 stop:876 length:489 start_codon:yes stop_codon:yes gene_type:complete